ncbi:MAG: Mycothiol S-conjugate amidase [Chlorobi bacterium]|nr:Mycothiol S-conjugate amidase [Chlorobiota bacterium]
MKKYLRISIIAAFAVLVLPLLAAAAPPRALIVIAHPDDESGFAATVYKITHDLGGTVDLALITNGEGGYKYSTLAEAYYHLELTDEKIGREYLPTIRKNELLAAGKILGIKNYFFFDQLDHRYTQNVDSVLKYVWDVNAIRTRLIDIMNKGKYDYVFCLLPTPDTHGGHKGASILAMEAAQQMTNGKHPIVLGGSVSNKSDTAGLKFSGLPAYPITNIKSGAPMFSFDRTQKFGYRDALTYKIIVNWEIAEHKSQGTMQAGMNYGDVENFWFFDFNDPAAITPTRELFEKLKIIPYPKKEYK